MPWHILFFSTKPANKRERIWLWTFCNVARHQARNYSLTSTAIGRQMANASYNDANFVSSRFLYPCRHLVCRFIPICLIIALERRYRIYPTIE